MRIDASVVEGVGVVVGFGEGEVITSEMKKVSSMMNEASGTMTGGGIGALVGIFGLAEGLRLHSQE